MERSKFHWLIQAKRNGQIFNISEMHRDFKEVCINDEAHLINACLIEVLDSVGREDPYRVAHFIDFKPDARLRRTFRRIEKGLVSGKTRVIPTLEYEEEGKQQFAFCFPDKVIITDNSRFHRKD